MSKLPSKRIIWLVIVLVVITISVLWYVGYQEQRGRETKKQQLAQDIIQKQKNLELAVAKAQKNPTADNLDDLILTSPDTIKVIVSSSTSTSSLRQYGLDLARALSFLTIKRDNEITLSWESISNNDQTKIKALVASRLKYETADNELSRVIVPTELVSQHRKLVANIKNIVIFLKQMELALEMPQAATMASRLFLQESVFLFGTVDKINNYLANRQINLTDQEKLKILSNFD